MMIVLEVKYQPTSFQYIYIYIENTVLIEQMRNYQGLSHKDTDQNLKDQENFQISP